MRDLEGVDAKVVLINGEFSLLHRDVDFFFFYLELHVIYFKKKSGVGFPLLRSEI